MRFRFGMRSLLALVALVAVLAGLVAAVGRASRNGIVVENRSGVAIKSLEITVGPTLLCFGPLPPNRSVRTSFPIHGDASFQVEGQLADGTPLTGGGGYVTNGMYGETARFTIEPGGQISFQQSR